MSELTDELVAKNGEELVQKLIIFGAAIVEIKYKKRMKDYEAYDIMHNSDGIVGESTNPSKL